MAVEGRAVEKRAKQSDGVFERTYSLLVNLCKNNWVLYLWGLSQWVEAGGGRNVEKPTKRTNIVTRNFGEHVFVCKLYNNKQVVCFRCKVRQLSLSSTGFFLSRKGSTWLLSYRIIGYRELSGIIWIYEIIENSN